MSINRNALKNYAPKARQDFISAVTARAAKFGISDGEPVPMQEQGDVVIIGGEAFSKKIGTQRKALLGRIRLHGFGQTMEEVAYTWFNRFLAIRYMELHGYLDHGFRVLSNQDGSGNPEILQNAGHVEFVGLDKAQVDEFLMHGTKDAELYRLLLVAQCNALHDAMPFLFEKIDDETELLLPDNLLHSDSLIRQLVNEIDEADWQEIEIIGWIYQFYISEKKDQVIGKVVKSEDIPAATQLFTPNWIVKYMVQNSLGHQWMATYPSSSLKDDMEYYIEPAEQTPEVQAQLAEITPKELNPEELTLLDPAAGSGHILVEAYDLFKQIYLERGYRLKDIPRLILEKNLYGLDIDDRAAQMAGFALLMKARADDRRILSNPVHLNVMAIQSSEGLDAEDIAKHLLASDTSGEVTAGTIESLINLFEDAKTFGSLITVPENIKEALPALEQLLVQPFTGELLQSNPHKLAVEELRPLIVQASMLGQKYDCVVANPPYMASKGMNGAVKSFVGYSYKDTKADICVCFIEKGLHLAKLSGTVSMITMETWMFLSSFASFRRKITSGFGIKDLIQMPYEGKKPTAMGINFGVCVFSIYKDKIPNFGGKYSSLHHADLNQNGTPKSFSYIKTTPNIISTKSFREIHGSPIAFSASKKIIALFSEPRSLGDYFFSDGPCKSGNDDKFLRFFWELSGKDIGVQNQWRLCSKGGAYRKYFGNIEHCLRWDSSTRKHYRSDNIARITPEVSWNKIGITWTIVTSRGGASFRTLPDYSLFNSVSPTIFQTGEIDLGLCICLLNSCVAEHFLSLMNPTLALNVENVLALPLVDNVFNVRTTTAEAFIELSQKDWASFEQSWDFKTFPILSIEKHRASLQLSYEAWEESCRSNIQTMKTLEEENNILFIEAYGLQDELTPDVPEDQITLARADREEDIKHLISYSIGCMMGRYSLAEEGLIYANSGNEGFDPTRYGKFFADDDGIIPITDTEWFDDDATVRFEEFLKIAWSPEFLKENLKFVGDSLANNGGNDPLKTIRNYLSKGFYKDHLKTYKKRPIYWLFSSGKQRAFECLVYLHRYNEGTLARMRMEYVTPLQSRMSARIEQLGDDAVSASSTAERNRKQKEKDKLVKQLEELRAFDEELRHYADQRITLDLDDGVKVNYGKFGNLLAEVKAITGKK